jgi:hypothetical protein
VPAGRVSFIIRQLTKITENEIMITIENFLDPIAAGEDRSEFVDDRKEEYFLAVRKGLDKDYQPMERIFSDNSEKNSTNGKTEKTNFPRADSNRPHSQFLFFGLPREFCLIRGLAQELNAPWMNGRRLILRMIGKAAYLPLRCTGKNGKVRRKRLVRRKVRRKSFFF